MEVLEDAVVTFTGYSSHPNSVVRKQLAWAAIARVFGQAEFSEDTIEDDSDDQAYAFTIKHGTHE